MNIFMVVVTILLALAIQQLVVERERRKRSEDAYVKFVTMTEKNVAQLNEKMDRHREKLTDAVMAAARQRRVYEQLPEPKERQVEKSKEYQRIV